MAVWRARTPSLSPTAKPPAIAPIWVTSGTAPGWATTARKCRCQVSGSTDFSIAATRRTRSSFFRVQVVSALAKDLVYGLSARGLAIGTGAPTAKRFPVFKAFWMERPEAETTACAYMPSRQPIDRRCLYLRRAPRRGNRSGREGDAFSAHGHGQRRHCSARQHVPARASRSHPAFRTIARSCTNSGSLAVLTGTGERIWRPLANPRALQMSAFLDEKTQGFGLIQRSRDFDTYLDLEARYHQRPSVWVDLDKNAGQAGSCWLKSRRKTNSTTIWCTLLAARRCLAQRRGRQDSLYNALVKTFASA